MKRKNGEAEAQNLLITLHFFGGSFRLKYLLLAFGEPLFRRG
jgi:hypothetical protein